MKKIFFCILGTFLYLGLAQAEIKDQGELAFEYRHFKDDNIASTEDKSVSFFSRLESRYEADSWRAVFRGFARVDEKDSDRSLMVLEDAYLRYSFDEDQQFNISAGYKIYNWSATEAFHPADSINSRNYDSNLEGLEKLGEPSLDFEYNYEDLTWTLYYFPRFENPEYPGARSRLGANTAIETPKIDNGNVFNEDQWVSQYGTSLSFILFDFDFSLHALSHIDRNFAVFGTDNYSCFFGTCAPNQSTVTPYYFRAKQYGLTAQGVVGPFLLKIEGAIRDFDTGQPVLVSTSINPLTFDLRQPVDHQEIAIGLEYGHSHDYGGESTFFFEFNTILGTTERTRAELSVFQRDIFLGVRHSLNDILAKEFTLGFFKDVEREHEHLYTFAYSQRITEFWKVRLGLRLYDAPKKGSVARGLEAYDDDHHGYFTILRYF